MPQVTIINADVLEGLRQLPSESVDCIVTSPPYWGLRDYGVQNQIGLEPTLDQYLERLSAVTAELRRVLKPTGVMFWVHGDCYGGNGAGTWKNPPEKIESEEAYHLPYSSALYPRRQQGRFAKCMMLQNYRLLLRLIDEQHWILRNIIVWHKPNPMPSGVRDRFTNAYEPIFMLVKERHYYFDLETIREPYAFSTLDRLKYPNEHRRNLGAGEYKIWTYPRGYLSGLGKNPGDVWTIPTQPFPEAHFATFPEALVERIIKAACPPYICRKCGKPRERIVERKSLERYELPPDDPRYRPARYDKKYKNNNPQRFSEHYTLGWTDCGCNAGWRPSVVLDPFLGSGTTALVAAKLQRDCIGIELNPSYVEMAVRRLRRNVPLFLQLEVRNAV